MLYFGVKKCIQSLSVLSLMFSSIFLLLVMKILEQIIESVLNQANYINRSVNPRNAAINSPELLFFSQRQKDMAFLKRGMLDVFLKPV